MELYNEYGFKDDQNCYELGDFLINFIDEDELIDDYGDRLLLLPRSNRIIYLGVKNE